MVGNVVYRPPRLTAYARDLLTLPDHAALLAEIGAMSDTAAGIVEAAIGSEVAAASSNTLAVTPGRVRFHPGVAKAWWYGTTSSGTATTLASHNVSGVSSAGVGLLTVSWDVDFASGNYVIVPNAPTSTGTYRLVNSIAQSSIGAQFARIRLDGVAFDGGWAIVAFGAQ